MTQYVEINCANCGRRLNVRVKYVGRKIVCKFCDHAFRVEAAEHVQSSSTASEPASGTSGESGSKAEIDRLQTELAAIQNERERLHGDVQRLTSDLESAEAQIAQLQSRAERADQLPEQVESLTTQVASLQAEVENRQREQEQSAEERNRLKAELETAAAGRDEAERMAAELEGLQQRLRAVEEEQASLRGERDRVAAELEKLEKSSREAGQNAQQTIAQLSEELERSRQQLLDRAENENGSDNRLQALESTFGAERQALQRRLERRRQEVDSLRETLKLLGVNVK